MSKTERQVKFEEKLAEKISEIHQMCKEYNPEGTFLEINIYDHDGDGVVSYHACNAYYGKDRKNPINLNKILVSDGEEKSEYYPD